MRRLLLIGVLALGVGAGPAYAAGGTPRTEPLSRAAVEQTVTARDAKDDVRTFDKVGDLGEGQRTSIDIRLLRITHPDAHTVRFRVKMRTITRSASFDQMAFLRLRPPADSSATWSTEIGMSPQQPKLAYAYFFPDDTGEGYRTCDPLTATVLRHRQSVSLSVPNRCVAGSSARITLRTLTGRFRSDAGIASLDFLRVPGLHELR